jgi:hypothetical protein
MISCLVSVGLHSQVRITGDKDEAWWKRFLHSTRWSTLFKKIGGNVSMTNVCR